MDINRVTANRNLFARHALCRLMAGMACMIVAGYSSRAAASEEASRFMAHYEESIYDIEAIDKIVARLHEEDGRFSALLMGVIESAPFQKRRNTEVPLAEAAPQQAPAFAK